MTNDAGQPHVAHCECCGRVERVYFDATCEQCHESRIFGEPHEHVA